jgi:hypothetical protein
LRLIQGFRDHWPCASGALTGQLQAAFTYRPEAKFSERSAEAGSAVADELAVVL